MPDDMQNFACYASKTLRPHNADNCTVPKIKNLPAHKSDVAHLAAVQTFSTNVKTLLSVAKSEGVSREQIAKAAGITLRTLGYQLEGNTAPTLRTVQAVAKAFDLPPYMLLLPDLPAEISLNPQLRQTVSHTIHRYVQAEKPDREVVERIVLRFPQQLR